MFPDKAASILERSLRTDPDRGVRKVAAYALGTSGSAEQVDALYEAAKQDQGTPLGGDGRELACVSISSLGSIGGARPAEALMRIWEDEQVRRGLEPVILTSLGTTGDLAVKPILEMAMQGDPALLRPCMIGFAELAKANPQDVQINRKAGDILRRGLGNADHRVRMIAATYLGFIGDRDDIGLLKGSLEDGYSETPSFVENGEERQRVCYPVQERAREAIERIRERLAREEQK
jgi:HEAT repeat protein